MSYKKINRNAFNEKIIHRYLFERYYFSDRKTRNLLLPEKYHKKEINLVVPEDNKKGDKYRADLTIYFKGERAGVPVEVKWIVKTFNKENQTTYIKKNNGFLISFEDIEAKEHNGVDYVKIDVKDFTHWATHNISKLTRESLMYQAKNKEVSFGNQFWLVFLRGSSHANFTKMLKKFPNNNFWAFTQNKHSLKNIFDMQSGDLCLFILGKANEGMGVSDNPNAKFEYKEWYITEVKEPYYMSLDDDKGLFFEGKNVPLINERRWPHFIDFKIVDYFQSNNYIDFGKRGELAHPLAESYNYGHGAPAPLLRREWDSLIDKLRAQKI